MRDIIGLILMLIGSRLYQSGYRMASESIRAKMADAMRGGS